MLQAMAALEARLTRVAELLSWVAMIALISMSVVILVDVCARWLLNSPLIGLEDITRLLVIVAVAACFPACTLKRGNITIRLLGEWRGERLARILDAFGAVVLLGFLGMLAWQVVKYAIEIGQLGETTWILRISVAPAYAAAGVSLAVAALLQIICTATSLLLAFAPVNED